MAKPHVYKQNELTAKALLMLVLVLFGSLSFAFAKESVSRRSSSSGKSSLNNDLESLGANQDIINRARALDPKNQVQVVQNRSVDRRHRVELSVGPSLVAGGDPYLNTYNLGLNLDYHITPRWSVGARYARSYNELTGEGKSLYDAAQNNRNRNSDYSINQVDFPINTAMAVVNWYPVYGKLNLFDSGVSQFDLYTLAGYGRIELASGWTDTYTAGAGVGFWWTNHWTSRFELRWQGYQDQIYSGSRQLNLTMATLMVGFLI